jgi:chemotaxis protein CheX
MSVGQEEIASITDYVWNTVLGLGLEPLQGAFTLREEQLTGCVSLTGSWEGTVTVACSSSFARQATGIMYKIRPEEASMQQVYDALGELANIVGGNIKACLPGPTALSLPVIVVGNGHSLAAGAKVCAVAFASLDEPVVVTLSRDEGSPGHHA